MRSLLSIDRLLLALSAIGACGIALLLPARAAACGVSGPDGVWSCSLEEHDEELRPRWHLGASGVYTSTRLRFADHLRGDETRYAALASAAYAPTRRLTFQLSAGAAFGGALHMPDTRYDFSVGPTFAGGVAYRLVEGTPFVVLTSLLSGAIASTHPSDRVQSGTGYEAFDLRLGAIGGVTLWHVLSPYALARAFGGPVFWRYQGRARTGTDVYHYQLGAGLALAPVQGFDVYVEGVPLGERGLSAGVAFAL